MSISVPFRSSSGVQSLSAETKLLLNRTILLKGEITEETANDVIEQLWILNADDPMEPVNLVINSPGGSIDAGLAIYDMLEESRSPIRTLCLQQSASMGAILFIAGKERYMHPHSMLMLHEPLVASGLGGNISSIKELSESLNKRRKKLFEIIAKHSSQNFKAVEKACSYEHHFTPEEAVDFGLCDHIGGYFDIIK